MRPVDGRLAWTVTRSRRRSVRQVPGQPLGVCTGWRSTASSPSPRLSRTALLPGASPNALFPASGRAHIEPSGPSSPTRWRRASARPLRPATVLWHGPRMASSIRVRTATTAELTAVDLRQMRTLLWEAFPKGEDGFTEDDWEHAMGGRHFMAEVDGVIVSHASVIEREIHVGGAPLRTGYVEAVGTRPEHERRGFGSAVVRAATDHVLTTYDFGVR